MQTSKVFFVLLFALYGCSFNSDETIRIGLIDSFFCVQDVNYAQVHVKKAYGANQAKQAVADASICLDLKHNKKSLHGHLVLQSILSSINYKKLKHKVEIFPVSVFEKNGKQLMGSWQEALKYLKRNKVTYIATASGHLSEDSKNLLDENLLNDFIIFAASGNRVYPITEKTFIWPQYFVNNDNGFLFAHYTKPAYAPKDGKIYGYSDFSIKYLSKVKYLIQNSTVGPLRMSSLSLSKYMAHLISYCNSELSQNNLSKIKKCLKRSSKELTLLNVKERSDFRSI
jgi:hypothetical protein